MTLLGRPVYYIWGYNVYIFIRFYLVSPRTFGALQGMNVLQGRAMGLYDMAHIYGVYIQG